MEVPHGELVTLAEDVRRMAQIALRACKGERERVAFQGNPFVSCTVCFLRFADLSSQKFLIASIARMVTLQVCACLVDVLFFYSESLFVWTARGALLDPEMSIKLLRLATDEKQSHLVSFWLTAHEFGCAGDATVRSSIAEHLMTRYVNESAVEPLV